MIYEEGSSSSRGAHLAPGFRFHPTDEELVSYYLKRKVLGRSLRVDAIAEADIYGTEPWDLPAMSRLRSGDREWYFFATLGRKYSGRSRTNRATRDGYWKTTGKDRPVLRRSSAAVVGMKKTLVYHAGRAPSGRRTDWVMHEYRLLHDAQDAYVVCRIFQKSGSGPQNGAQYGAPFLEEEWEEEDEKLEKGVNDFLQLDDLGQKQDIVHEHEIPMLFATEGNAQNDGITPQDSANLFEEMFYVGNYVNAPELEDDPNLINLGANTGLDEQSQSPNQPDGYLELKDILGNGSVDYPSNENSFDLPHEMFNDQIFTNGVNGILTSDQVLDAAFFDGLNVTLDAEQLGQMCLPVEGNFPQQTDGSPNPLAGDYNSAQVSEGNMVFHDACGEEFVHEDDSFMDANQLQFSPVADGLDELMAYFDATDNNLPFIQDFSECVEFCSSNAACSNSAPEVEANSSPAFKETSQGANIEQASSSSTRSAESDNKFGNIQEGVMSVPDGQGNESWNRSLRRHVVSMLGSINAPPAMAEDHEKQKAIRLASTTNSSSSIHITAGMIQVHGAVMGSEERWTLLKNGDACFFLSYGTTSNDVVNKSVFFNSSTNMQDGAMSTMLKGGFYLLGISMLILATCFKVGMCIYSQ